MSSSVPFSTTATDIDLKFGTTDGVAAGYFRTSIPTNFQNLKNAILANYNCIAALAAAAGAGVSGFAAAGANEHFQVRRAGEALFAANPGGPGTMFLQNSGAFTGPTYTGGLVAPGGGSTYSYIPSLFPGWYMAREAFSDNGQVFGAGNGEGARLTWDMTLAYANDTTTTGTAAAGDGDIPAFYQVLSRHIPIETMIGRAVNIRFRYTKALANAVGNTFSLYIAYSDGTTRYDAISDPINGPVTDGVVSFSTGDLTAGTVFTSGVIPATATSVEVGLVMTGTGGVGTEVFDVAEFSTSIGTARNRYETPPYALDYAHCAMHYSQFLSPSITGETALNTADTNHPLLTEILVAGGAVPSSAVTSLQASYPWALAIPWRQPTTTTVPDCRVLEFIGTVMDTSPFAVLPDFAMDAVADGIVMTVTNGVVAMAGQPFDTVGLTTHLDRLVTANPIPAASVLFNRVALGRAVWSGEIACAISPLLF